MVKTRLGELKRERWKNGDRYVIRDPSGRIITHRSTKNVSIEEVNRRYRQSQPLNPRTTVVKLAKVYEYTSTRLPRTGKAQYQTAILKNGKVIITARSDQHYPETLQRNKKFYQEQADERALARLESEVFDGEYVALFGLKRVNMSKGKFTIQRRIVYYRDI